jgi:hypothetical protein
MEDLRTQELEVQLLEAVLFDEKTGELQPPEERAGCLDVIRLKLVGMGTLFDDMEEMAMPERVLLLSAFMRVVETYLGIAEKHEEFLAEGR